MTIFQEIAPTLDGGPVAFTGGNLLRTVRIPAGSYPTPCWIRNELGTRYQVDDLTTDWQSVIACSTLEVLSADPGPPPNILTPNEPAGMTFISDQPWDTLESNGWFFVNPPKPPTLETDPGAPYSPPDVCRIVQDSDSNSSGIIETEFGFYSFKRLYTAWWVRLSAGANPWNPNLGAGKHMWILHGTGHHTSFIVDPRCRSLPTTTAPVELEFSWQVDGSGPGDSGNLLPNTASSPLMTRGQWHLVECEIWINSATNVNDGGVRVWLDTNLVIDYPNGVDNLGNPLFWFNTTTNWPTVDGMRYQNFRGGSGNSPPLANDAWTDVDHIYQSGSNVLGTP